MFSMKDTARHRIMDYVLRHPGTSAAQIGRALKLSPAAVRHHMRILCKDGRIVRTGASKARSRGRPARTYRPGDRLLGDNLALVADSLLRAWPRGRRAPLPSDMISALANGLLRRLGPDRGDGSLARRLATLVGALDAAHYHARWEAGPEGPRVIFGHCPYAALIERHPELCQMDREALARYIGADVTQLARIDVRGYTVNQCMFALRHGGPPAARHESA